MPKALPSAPENPSQTIHQLKILNTRAKPITPNFRTQRVDNRLDILPRHVRIQLVILKELQRHDRSDLPLGDELAAEVEKCGQIGLWEIHHFVRVWLGGGRVGDVRGWGTGRHQGVPGEGHIFVVGFGDEAAAEVIGVCATGAFEAVV